MYALRRASFVPVYQSSIKHGHDPDRRERRCGDRPRLPGPSPRTCLSRFHRGVGAVLLLRYADPAGAVYGPPVTASGAHRAHCWLHRIPRRHRTCLWWSTLGDRALLGDFRTLHRPGLYGFGAAGVGMLISLAIYRSGRRWMPAERTATRARSIARPRLSRQERSVVIVLILLLPVLAIGTVGNQQIFSAYLLWVPNHVDMVLFGRTMPTTWLITVDAVVSIVGLLATVAFWRLWSKRFREPSEIIKMTLGFAFSVGALLSLTAAAAIAISGRKASIGWVLAFEVLNSIGFANVLPVGLALYARASPKAVAGTMIGVYFLHLFMTNNLVGWLGGLLERLPGPQFWALHAALVGTAGVLTLGAARLFGQLLTPTGAASSDAAGAEGDAQLP